MAIWPDEDPTGTHESEATREDEEEDEREAWTLEREFLDHTANECADYDGPEWHF